MDQALGPDRPTIRAPLRGTVYARANLGKFQLAEAEYWMDDDGVVVRSREFDCFATGRSLEEAVSNFGDAVFDYAAELHRRADRGALTPTEKGSLNALSMRLTRLYLAERRASGRRRVLDRLRRRRTDRGRCLPVG